MIAMDLVRLESSLEHGTFGVLLVNGKCLCVTAEPPWLNNLAHISCIPNGYYEVIRVNSPSFGNTFEVFKVPDRTHILFHAGNYVEHTEGCILLAERFGEYKGHKTFNNKRGILNGRQAFDKFKKVLEGVDRFVLKIESMIPN